MALRRRPRYQAPSSPRFLHRLDIPEEETEPSQAPLRIQTCSVNQRRFAKIALYLNLELAGPSCRDPSCTDSPRDIQDNHWFPEPQVADPQIIPSSNVTRTTSPPPPPSQEHSPRTADPRVEPLLTTQEPSPITASRRSRPRARGPRLNIPALSAFS